ncbi:MAG TPA: hypothetical protein VGP37_11765 [Candidatus Nanopelagicales bacterium]|nr:hypothetical protein [Candidatus Nanopelagicales bacterium]
MRTFTRLTSVGAATALIIGVTASPALADEEDRPIKRVTAPLVDLDGDPIEAQDPGIPAGDGDNAVDPESVAVDRGARLAIELSHALGSRDAQDMKGFEESLYRGKWYMPKKENIRRCIMDRESNHRYRAVSAGGMYRGAYQMNRELARGATFMMQKEVKKEMPEAVTQVKKLRKIPTQQWSRYWQDRAFWTIWRKGKGKHHWRGGAWKC